MARTIVRTPEAPAAIGPYSQAVVTPIGDNKRMIFTSGQIALDPVTGKIVEGDVERQTRQVLTNVGAVLAGADAGFEHVVKATVFLADMNDFETVNRIYAERFPHDAPARSTIQAARLPRDARVEIEVIAIV
ncbi:MAG: Rid family detoxifying hydrolase [Kofleriaceae bacterium]